MFLGGPPPAIPLCTPSAPPANPPLERSTCPTRYDKKGSKPHAIEYKVHIKLFVGVI